MHYRLCCRYLLLENLSMIHIAFVHFSPFETILKLVVLCDLWFANLNALKNH